LCSGRSTRHPGPQVQAAGAIDEVMRWHVSGFDDDAPQALSGWHHEPSDEHRRLAEAMTRALQRADPTELDRPASVAAVAPRQPPPGRGEADRHRAAAISAAVPEPSSPADTRELRIWGSASAGKTVYLSQLFMKHRHGGDSDWCVRLPAGSDPETVQFYEARLERFKKDNAFPAPTSRGDVKEIVYHLVNERTGQRVGIAMEDRPGADFENVDADMARRLAAADGLLMLLDPRRDPADQTHEVLKTLLAMQQVRMDDGRDPRPLAVCISKCDELVGSAEAYRIALQTPEMLPGIALATSVREALVHYFETWRVFALSAAGLRRRHGAVEPGVFYDESFKLRINADAEPLNLLEPLLWLLEHVDR
jgi:hypothetical protein